MRSTKARWRLLQLADSGFPAGGFSHSYGLEAALRLGHVRTPDEVIAFTRDALDQAAHAQLPLLVAAYQAPQALEALDAKAHAFLLNEVTRRASVALGAGLLQACARAFPESSLAEAAAALRQGTLHGHLGPVFGRVAQALGLPLPEAVELFLFITVRGLFSAAVRLGLWGPFEAQRRQDELSAQLDELCAAALARADEPLRLEQTQPFWDLVAAQHDRLYSRLFQS